MKHNPYAQKSVSLDRMIVTPMGVVTPRCQNCKTLDCGHVIENKTVSVFGINKTYRCLISSGTPFIVYDCEGYTE